VDQQPLKNVLNIRKILGIGIFNMTSLDLKIFLIIAAITLLALWGLFELIGWVMYLVAAGVA
jgi:hypothetical protein